MPSDRNSSSDRSKCFFARANRSKRQTTIASNCRLRASPPEALGRKNGGGPLPSRLTALLAVCHFVGIALI
jgi:hypothetical protein